MGQAPSVCRDVHYVAHGSADGTYPKVCRAAKVTEVNADDPETVAIVVFNPTGLFFHQASKHAEPVDGEMPPGGTWHWPERV